MNDYIILTIIGGITGMAAGIVGGGSDVLIVPSLATHLTTLPPLNGLMLLELLIAQGAPCKAIGVLNPNEVAVST